MVRVTNSPALPASSSLAAPYLAWCACACIACAVRCENGSRAPCAVISPATASSEVAFQNNCRNCAARVLRTYSEIPLSAMIAHEAIDIAIRIASSVLPTASV